MMDYGGIMSNKNNQTISVSAPAKLLLFGEYLVLQGYSAFGIPIDLYTHAFYASQISTLSSMIPTGINLNAQAYDTSLQIISSTKIDEEFYNHLFKVCKNWNIPLPEGAIFVKTTIPLASGLGSSASFCVCMAKILVTLNKKLFSSFPDISILIWTIAHQLEHFFHKSASGIDTAIVVYNKSLLLEVQTPQLIPTPSKFSPTFIDLDFKDYLVYGFTPRFSNKTTISTTSKWLKKNISENNLETMRWIDAHNKAIKSIKTYQKDMVEIQTLVEELAVFSTIIHTQMTMLQLSHSIIDDILEQAHISGALGGKISGAGFGGAFYYFCKNTKS